MNIILSEGLEDRKFIEERTENFEEMKKVVDKYPAEKVAEICHVDVDKLIEAARIDGSKEWNTFNKIILPIMKPAVATQAIFQFIAQWNNLFTPTILLTTDSKKTLPMFVQLLSSNQFRTDYGVVYVGLFVTIILWLLYTWYFPSTSSQVLHLAVLRVDGVYEKHLIKKILKENNM